MWAPIPQLRHPHHPLKPHSRPPLSNIYFVPGTSGLSMRLIMVITSGTSTPCQCRIFTHLENSIMNRMVSSVLTPYRDFRVPLTGPLWACTSQAPFRLPLQRPSWTGSHYIHARPSIRLHGYVRALHPRYAGCFHPSEELAHWVGLDDVVYHYEDIIMECLSICVMSVNVLLWISLITSEDYWGKTRVLT